MNNWNILILGIFISAGIFFTWREKNRSDKRRLWIRLLAMSVAITGLVGMGITILRKPAYKKQLPVYMDSASIKKNTDTGFLTIHWPQVLKSGEPFVVQGRYANINAESVTIILHGFSSDLDSMIIPADSQKEFSLTTIPKQRGKTVFQISVRKSAITIESEPLPLVIQPPDSLSIFILSSYPDFENKFLNRWMGDNRYHVVQRTRISRDRSEHVFLNCQPFPVGKLDEKLLGKFDLLICDPGAFGALTSAEQKAIMHQIGEYGLGLLIKADSADNKKYFYSDLFPAFQVTEKKTGRRELVAADRSWSLSYPSGNGWMGVRYKEGTQPLLSDADGRIVVNSYQLGLGRIVFSTLNSSYILPLEGRSAEYALLWTLLIEKTAKRSVENMRFWIKEQFPQKNRALEFNFEMTGPRLTRATVGSHPVFLHERKIFSPRWYGSFWPEHTGWQPAVHIAGHYFEWYVYDEHDWRSLIKNKKPSLFKNLVGEKTGNLLYFFIFFMSGWLFMWIERKLSLI